MWPAARRRARNDDKAAGPRSAIGDSHKNMCAERKKRSCLRCARREGYERQQAATCMGQNGTTQREHAARRFGFACTCTFLLYWGVKNRPNQTYAP